MRHPLAPTCNMRYDKCILNDSKYRHRKETDYGTESYRYYYNEYRRCDET